MSARSANLGRGPRPPAVSVVLPVRNRATLVEAAARTVLNQTWRDLELVVVDGGSTDGTVGVLRRLAASDRRVRLVLQEQADGVAAARNAGAAVARGRWLAFQDSDDAWHPEKLERQMAALAAMPTARLAYAGLRRRFPGTEVLRPAAWDGSAGRVDGDLHGAVLRRSLMTTPTMVVDRTLFHAVGGFDPELRYNEDWDLAVRLTARSPVACAADWLVDSPQLEDSLTRDREAQLRSLRRMLVAQEPLLRADPAAHEYRLAEAGLRLLANRRAGGLRLVGRSLAVRPLGLHGPFWQAVGDVRRDSRRGRKAARARAAAAAP